MASFNRPGAEKPKRFNGKLYEFVGYTMTKSDANRMKSMHPSNKWNIRIVRKSPTAKLSGGYFVYRRKKT